MLVCHVRGNGNLLVLKDTLERMTAAARKALEDGLALENSGQLDKALVSYLKAQELSPNDTEIAYKTASALMQAGYLEEAQSQLRRIVFAEPEHLSARASLGNCQLLLGDVVNARQNFSEVLEQAPDNRNALYGLASVLLKEGDPTGAIEPARQLLELLPGSPAVLTLFAQTQDKTGQNTAAIAAYRKALKSGPDYLPALLGLSETLLRRKRFDEVVELTVRASQIAPADPQPLEMLSDALAGRGDFDDAIEASREALKLAPRSVPLYVRLSVLSRKLGKQGDALRYALAGHDIDQLDSDPFNAIGAALASLKHGAQARSVLTGLATGNGLAADIRAFIETAIAKEAEKVAARPARTAETGDVQADDIVAAEEEPQPGKTAESEAMTEVSRETDEVDPKGESESPLPVPTSGGNAPGVLGLQRQDRS